MFLTSSYNKTKKYREEDLSFVFKTTNDKCTLRISDSKTNNHIITFEGRDQISILKRFNVWGSKNISRFKAITL